jgi:LuxR family transcriptional regulator, quorum-sensing system regulator CciR
MQNASAALFSLENVDLVRISGPDDVRRAAEALHQIVLNATNMRVAPAHDIADKRTPVDADGAILARDVFGWLADDKVWWKNSRIALDSPLTSACRFESEPFWVNSEGFRTRQTNPYQ